MMPATRIGMIGAGAVALRHVQCLSSFDDVAIAAVADPALEAARSLAARCGAVAFPGHEAMLEDAALDAVYICVPPFAHGRPERDVIAAGLPFFVEKPVALDVSVAEAIAADVRRAGLLTATGYWWRHLDVVERATELLAGDPVRLAIGAWIDKLPPPAWWARRDRSGGQVVEQATHVVDLLRLLVGEVSDVWATGTACSLDGADIDDVTAGTLRFAGGAIGSLVSTCALTWKHSTGVELYTADAVLQLSDAELTVTTTDSVARIPAAVDAKRLADRAFVDAVRGADGDVRADYAEAVATHRVACALAESAHSGQPVRLPTGSPVGSPLVP